MTCPIWASDGRKHGDCRPTGACPSPRGGGQRLAGSGDRSGGSAGWATTVVATTPSGGTEPGAEVGMDSIEGRGGVR